MCILYSRSKAFNSNLDVVDDAFEYLMSKSSKWEKGQYFTSRYVIDMCVKMLNPKSDETMIDPASGSRVIIMTQENSNDEHWFSIHLLEKHNMH